LSPVQSKTDAFQLTKLVIRSRTNEPEAEEEEEEEEKPEREVAAYARGISGKTKVMNERQTSRGVIKNRGITTANGPASTFLFGSLTGKTL